MLNAGHRKRMTKEIARDRGELRYIREIKFEPHGMFGWK